MSFVLSDYHRTLIVRSEGRESTLTTLLYNAWMIDHRKVYDALNAATGKTEFFGDDFEDTAKFLLKAKA